MNSPHILTIYLDGDGWMVKDNDPETLRLFGTDTLPTPFLRETPRHQVIEGRRHLNPDAFVCGRIAP